MTSRRLPGKPLLRIGTKPLLQHIVEQMKRCKGFTRVVVATTTNTADDPIANLAKKLGVDCFRGSEDDVLSRFIAIGKKYDADHIARVCGDQPFNDPELLDKIIQTHCESGADLTSTALERTFPKGVDIELLSRAALQKLEARAHTPEEREHVTLYAVRHPEEFVLRNYRAPAELNMPDVIFTVDTSIDLQFVRAVAAAAGNRNSVAEILKTIKSKSIVRKPLVVFRADGGHTLGMGHIANALECAHLLKMKAPVDIVFLTKNKPAAIEKITGEGYTVISFSGAKHGYDTQADVKHIIEVLADLRPSAYLVDVLASEKDYAPTLRALGIATVLFDVKGTTAFKPDIIFNRSSAPERLQNYSSNSRSGSSAVGVSTKYFTGPKYAPLHPQFLAAGNKAKNSSGKKSSAAVREVLVTFGGSDVRNSTPKALRALAQSTCATAHITVVIGPAYARKVSTLSALIRSLKLNATIVRNPPSMAELMQKADLAISAAGRTLYELAFTGTPTLVVAIEPEQPANAREFELAGAARYLGWTRDLPISAFAKAISELAQDADKRAKMSAAGREMIDGKGSERIGEILNSVVFSSQ